jgi:hypothetical protein
MIIVMQPDGSELGFLRKNKTVPFGVGERFGL